MTREVATVDVLEHRVVVAVVDAEAEHRDEVAMMEPATERGLVDQRALELVIAGELGREQLDRDLALESARTVGDREMDLGHAAASDAAHELVGSDRAYHWWAWLVARQSTATSSMVAAAAFAANCW